jgi:hypothetical protein
MFSRGQSALQTRDGRCLRPHALGHCGLSKACILARFEQGIKKRGLFMLNAFDFRPNAGTLHEFLYQLIMSLHV